MGETYIKQGNAARKVFEVYRKVGGQWSQAIELYSKIPSNGQVKNVFSAEIIITIPFSRTDVILENLFTAEQWASSARKRVIINAGVTISGSSHDWALAAQGGGRAASWGGTLTLDNYGSIQGRGGNYYAGRGGDVIYTDPAQNWSKKLLINNFGGILAGGGGGGNGGQGGNGFWDETVQEGPAYNVVAANGPLYYHQTTSRWVWNNEVRDGWRGQGVTVDGWRWYFGNFRDNSLGPATYEIYRQQEQRRWTSGGGGGGGGRGQGSDGANTGGFGGGGPSGPNAGWGGTGGTGGGWGQPGNPGAQGGGGNNGGGQSGGGGGAAGIAYRTAVAQIVSNTGQILGRVT